MADRMAERQRALNGKASGDITSRLPRRLSLLPEVLVAFKKILPLEMPEQVEEIDWNAVLHDLVREPVGAMNTEVKVKA